VTKPLRILVIDDHAMLRAGCSALLSRWPGAEVFEAGSGDEGLAVSSSNPPDVVLLDLNLPGMSGFDVLKRLTTDAPAARVIVFSMYEDPVFAARAIQMGAKSYITKADRPETLLDALEAVVRGEDYLSHRMAQKLAIMELRSGDTPLRLLTQRELDVLRLYASGKSLGEIAGILDIGYRTVANVIALIKRKLNVTTTAKLVLVASQYMKLNISD
jgi:DNA-binding NarL/FixJ family response regulator